MAREYQQSFKVWDSARFNWVWVNEETSAVSFASYDPVEQKTLVINYPSNLIINSRSVGEYRVGTLYKLGGYEGKGGEFARRKVQGFMRTPITGYTVGGPSLRSGLLQAILKARRESNLSRLDAWYLWLVLGKQSMTSVGEDELIRSGVITKNEEEDNYDYSAERLAQFLGERLFDWKVGKEGATVAVVNMSGIDGMAADMARFLTNMGLDVVAVRSGSEVSDKTKILTDPEMQKRIALASLTKVFDFGEAVRDPKTREYRADIVIEVGTDALSLF